MQKRDVVKQLKVVVIKGVIACVRSNFLLSKGAAVWLNQDRRRLRAAQGLTRSLPRSSKDCERNFRGYFFRQRKFLSSKPEELAANNPDTYLILQTELIRMEILIGQGIVGATAIYWLCLSPPGAGPAVRSPTRQGQKECELKETERSYRDGHSMSEGPNATHGSCNGARATN